MRRIFASFSLHDLETVCWTQTAPKGRLQTQHLNFAAAENSRPPFWLYHVTVITLGTNSKHWFTTSFLQLNQVPKSDAQSVRSLVVECCSQTVGLLGTGTQDGHLDFHTQFLSSEVPWTYLIIIYTGYVVCKSMVRSIPSCTSTAPKI